MLVKQNRFLQTYLTSVMETRNGQQHVGTTTMTENSNDRYHMSLPEDGMNDKMDRKITDEIDKFRMCTPTPNEVNVLFKDVVDHQEHQISELGRQLQDSA